MSSSSHYSAIVFKTKRWSHLIKTLSHLPYATKSINGCQILPSVGGKQKSSAVNKNSGYVSRTDVTRSSGYTAVTMSSDSTNGKENAVEPSPMASSNEKSVDLQSKTQDNHLQTAADNDAEESRRLRTKALSFLAMVNEDSLSPAQIAIHKAHLQALQAGEEFYTDPSTGYQVMSRLAHLKRGDCCGNACRHCPYGQRNAPTDLRRHYNSAFYD